MKINLNDINKKTPYKVPDQYFDELTSNIQHKISTQNQGRFIYFKSLKLALVPVLMIMLISGLWLFNATNGVTPDSQLLLSEVSDEAILDYLYESDLSINELISLTDNPINLIDQNPDYLNGLDLREENIDELINTFDLNEIYL